MTQSDSDEVAVASVDDSLNKQLQQIKLTPGMNVWFV